MDTEPQASRLLLKTIFLTILLSLTCLAITTITSLNMLCDTSVQIQKNLNKAIQEEINNQAIANSTKDILLTKLATITNNYQTKIVSQKTIIFCILFAICCLLIFISYILAKRQAFKATLSLRELASKSHNAILGNFAPIELTTNQLSRELSQIVLNINKVIADIKTKDTQLKELQLSENLPSNEETASLESTTKQLNALQEQLDKTSKLALIGEMSGHVVHEVLNPITEMLFQIQKKIEELSTEDQEVIGELREVIYLWQDKFQKGELMSLLSKEKNNKKIGDHSFELILAYLRILAIEKTEIRERFKFLEKGIHRIIAILGLLKQKNKKELELEENLDIRKIIQESYTFIAEKLKSTNITLIEEYEPNLPKITANSGELVEVFLNLFQNAYQSIIKNATQGKIIISATKKNDCLEIRIKDSGPGIPKEAENKLFTFGFTTKKTGSGLGLAICRRLLQTHGGNILLEDNKTKSNFTVFLVKIAFKEKNNTV